MPNRNYERGRRNEYKSANELRKRGYTVMRMAGSKGLYDRMIYIWTLTPANSVVTSISDAAHIVQGVATIFIGRLQNFIVKYVIENFLAIGMESGNLLAFVPIAALLREGSRRKRKGAKTAVGNLVSRDAIFKKQDFAKDVAIRNFRVDLLKGEIIPIGKAVGLDVVEI